MIKFENVEVMGIEGALRGMRNPLNSWDKSDSGWPSVVCGSKYHIGPNDLALARKLVKAGNDHRKFLRQIVVSVDITAPLYWWKEYDTYKVATTANSTSTMHRIHANPITVADFSTDRLSAGALDHLLDTIGLLEQRRRYFVETGDRGAWDDIIQLLPSSYNQLRTCTMSFETLLGQYYARKAHKLQEWRDYCDLIKMLPYFTEICLEG